MLGGLAGAFAPVRNATGRPETVTIRSGTGTVHVAETIVVLHRLARPYTGKRNAKGTK